MSGAALAVIAGSGALPAVVMAACPGAHLVRIEGAGCTVQSDNVIEARFEQMGALFDAMRAAGVAEVCFAGAMQRPPLDPSKLDPVTLAAAPKVMAALQKGDDGLLRAVIELFEEHGFGVRGAHEFAPELVATGGVLAGAPSDAQIKDARAGQAILSALAPLDVGQACVVAAGLCFGVETIQGTDALLRFVETTRSGLRPETGGVLVKRAKAGQDLRVDMPTIGPATVTAAAAAGLDGIAIEPGRVLIVERDKTVAQAEALGIALWAST